MSKDALGERMKENYENRTRLFLPRRTYTIIRLDGKAFHTFTKGFKRPYDTGLMDLMDKTAVALCESIQGAKLAYVQSDEISLVLTDFESQQTDAWFDGNIQKIVSVSASIATAAFNKQMILDKMNRIKDVLGSATMFIESFAEKKWAHFDSRTYTIPELTEVVNYLIWRQQDATRNSIQMGAQALYSQKELNKKNTSELQELMFQKGINWNDYPVGFKRGRVVVKEQYEHFSIEDHSKYGNAGPTMRTKWVVKEPPIFSQDKNFLLSRLPKNFTEIEKEATD